MFLNTKFRLQIDLGSIGRKSLEQTTAESIFCFFRAFSWKSFKKWPQLLQTTTFPHIFIYWVCILFFLNCWEICSLSISICLSLQNGGKVHKWPINFCSRVNHGKVIVTWLLIAWDQFNHLECHCWNAIFYSLNDFNSYILKQRFKLFLLDYYLTSSFLAYYSMVGHLRISHKKEMKESRKKWSFEKGCG